MYNMYIYIYMYMLYIYVIYICYIFDTSHWMSLSLPWNIIFVLSTLQKHLASGEQLSQAIPVVDRHVPCRFYFLGGMFFCSPEKSKVPMNVPSLFKMMLQQRFLSGKWCFNNGVFVQELHMIQGYPKHSKTTNRNVRVLPFGLQSTYMVVIYMYANVYAIYLYIHTL